MASLATQIAQKLAVNAEAVCKFYLSSGKRNGRYWLVGDVNNNPGRSLYVRLAGTESGPGAAGKWTDSATGEHGDLLDIIRVSAGLSRFRDVLEEARRFLSEPRYMATPNRERAPRNTTPAARRLFAGSKPLVGTLGETYLRGRGITCSLDLPALRYHPGCFHRARDNAPKSEWPAIIAAVTNLAGDITGVHRTWLARDGSGKAPLETPRRSMGDILGSAIWLGSPETVCAVGEGLETVLALRSLMPGMCVAAATSANHLALVDIPQGVQRLYTAVDNDVAGRNAAEHLAWRLIESGIENLLLTPPIPWDDWDTFKHACGHQEAVQQLLQQLHPKDRSTLFGV